MTSALTQRMPQLLALVAALVAAEAVVAVPLVSISLTIKMDSWWVLALAIFIGIAGLAVFRRYAGLIQRVLCACAERLAGMPTSRWLLGTLGAGAVLRLLWALLLPVEPKSDSAIYVQLARALADGGPYYIAHTWAYWPPGYPLYLSLWMRLGLSEEVIIVASNLLHYACATALTYAVARKFTNEGTARLAATTLALWPSLITAAGIAQKEQLLVPLLLATIYLFLSFSQPSTQSRLISWIAAGALLGFGCLVQPSLQLFVLVLAFIGIVSGWPWRHVVLATIATTVAAALVIAPWTVRNMHHFDSFVLISTNGGDNMYRANNPLATGGYTERGEHDYGTASETQKNTLGFHRTWTWIRANPGDFVRLALWKQILFLGDDSDGVYETLRRGMGVGGAGYVLPKLAMQGFWWVLWLVILQRMLARPIAHLTATCAMAIVFAPFAYLWLLHSVFESSGKYHVPVFGFVPLLLAIQYGAVTDRSASSWRGRPAGHIQSECATANLESP